MKKNTDEVISKISYHSIKKFELIESYVSRWSRILVNNDYCEELIYIDCMSNSGEYKFEGKNVFGSGPRVFKILNNVAKEYPNKDIKIIFNDLSKDKIDHLKEILGTPAKNLKVLFYNEDANSLLKKIKGITKMRNTHYLLIYDPYEASIDWDAIKPFINNWGEVIINHMVYDSSRAVKMAKTDEAKLKYEKTYKLGLEDLIPYGSNKSAYEDRLKEIIKMQLENDKDYYISAFPFFNMKNSLMYDLIHCTSNIKGFTLFKSCAWKTFEGKSSNKKTPDCKQFTFNFDHDNDFYKTNEDTYCYNILNIAEYLYQNFKGRQDVNLNDLWRFLDSHPIFPSDCFKKEIKKELKNIFGVIEHKSTLDF